ncbi:hypothetical protein P3342_013181 [Pyrenophora teres f. teres]|nr:hypothetical protein P3342_013181 [Pyrenophora teres f. teres]
MSAVEPADEGNTFRSVHHPSPIATMYQEHESMLLEDGRTFSYAIYGSPMPRQTIVYLHGFPSSRFEGKLWHSSCATRNVRLIAPDRPGHGISSFQVKRRILDFPSDVLALTEHLKIHQFYILGLSGGAPYVLACVKKIAKDRLLGATVKAIKGPQNWPIFVAMTRESFQQGSEGASWEAKLNGSDWGFSLAQLSVGDNGVPLTLWHGLDDRNCPATMAQQAKDFMPGSVLRLKEGEGHVSFIFRDAHDILDDLLGQAESEEYIIPAIL